MQSVVVKFSLLCSKQIVTDSSIPHVCPCWVLEASLRLWKTFTNVWFLEVIDDSLMEMFSLSSMRWFLPSWKQVSEKPQTNKHLVLIYIIYSCNNYITVTHPPSQVHLLHKGFGNLYSGICLNKLLRFRLCRYQSYVCGGFSLDLGIQIKCILKASKQIS